MEIGRIGQTGRHVLCLVVVMERVVGTGHVTTQILNLVEKTALEKTQKLRLVTKDIVQVQIV